ncbi:MAG: alpha-amylase family glycosyl hydrolase [Elusimicrobiales bacterium]
MIEINTRLWLRQLRVKYSLPEMTLSSVPDDEWLELRHLGVDIIWLVGVWEASPESERIAKEDRALLEDLKKLPPGFDASAVGPSPYSVHWYRLNSEYGFEWELKALREKLNSLGMKLMVDLVSNHTAKDNPYIKECPDCFINGSEEDFRAHPDWFFEMPDGEKKLYIAYGRDPNFPAWTDTAQLNYFNPATRDRMLNVLMRIADMADGVRCDMVMLTLNEIHEGTWGWLLGRGGYKRPQEEFWEGAIKAVKEKHPEFVFLAEVYWGLEWRVQQIGFDYTYDKGTYDRLRFQGPQEVRGHLRAEKLYQKRSARFIDNHDEQPSLEAFGRQKAMAAGVVVSTIKGLRFYNDNQLDGVRARVPLQLKELYDRVPDLEVKKFYAKLLKITDHPAFHGGEWALLDVKQCDQENKTNANILAWSWAQRRTLKVVAVNYSGEASCGVINVSIKSDGETTAIFEELSDRFFSFKSSELSGGLRLQQMAPYSAYIFDVEF